MIGDGSTVRGMTKKSAGALLLLLGAVLLGVGLYLGYASVNRAGVDCGSGFGGVSQNADVSDLERAMEADRLGISDPNLTGTSDSCTSAVSDRDTLAKAVVIPGAVIGAAALLVLLFSWQTAPGPPEPPAAA